MNSILKNYGSYFASFLQSSIIIVRFTRTGDLVFKVFKDNFVPFVFFAKHFGLALFKHINDYTAIDYPEKKKRFELVYSLLSIVYNHRIKVSVATDEITPVDSITDIFNSADWLEREAWDMFGIFFIGHKDLRRILTDYGFRGHPLRKDFPLTGYVEVRYDEIEKRVVTEKVSLAQDYRVFSFNSNWLS